MIRATTLALLFALGITTALPRSAAAGSSGANGEARYAAADVHAFAKTVEDELARRGARVALVARIGRDPSEMPDGLRFSHVAWWVYSEITLVDGRKVPGYVIHNLYQDDSDPGRSSLVQDFPPDFFRSVELLEAGVLVPTPEVQAKLLTAISTDVGAAVHVPRYSLVASPFDPTYQNCTEHALDTLNAALYETRDMDRLKRIARQHFTASKVEVGFFAELLGPIFVRELTTSDHTGGIRTTTFESLSAFMRDNGLALEVFTVSRPARPIS